jgi:hypothetical protein
MWQTWGGKGKNTSGIPDQVQIPGWRLTAFWNPIIQDTDDPLPAKENWLLNSLGMRESVSFPYSASSGRRDLLRGIICNSLTE